VGSNAKQRTTMAKRNRENAVRERKARKAIRKEERKRAAAEAASAPPEGEVVEGTVDADASTAPVAPDGD
jgi:hypothetical protein